MNLSGGDAELLEISLELRKLWASPNQNFNEMNDLLERLQGSSSLNEFMKNYIGLES
jgi:hypothetical protein